MNAKRSGVILAAGMGIRMRDSAPPLTIHKALLPIGDLPLIVRTIHSLEKAACREVLIVLGWQGERLRRAVLDQYSGNVELDFVWNTEYRLKNGVSALAVQDRLAAEFVLTMADHVLDDRILELTLDHSPRPGGATLCVDYKLSSIFDMDDATKVLEKDGLVLDIGKDLDHYNCIDTGVFVATGGLMESIREVYVRKGDASLTDGVKRLANQARMRVLDIGNAFWQDVDTPEMLAKARDLVEGFQY